MQVDPITAAVLRSAVHDLKGPASRLRLLVGLLRRGESSLDEDARSLLGHMESSAAEVGAVAEGLRAYLEVCTRPVQREPLALAEALAGAVSAIESELRSTGAQIEPSTLPQVHADRFLIAWLLQELLTNAIRFRGEAAPHIRVSEGPGYISVTDNGPGIEAELAERAFRPFQKLTPKGGAGLGLTICRKITELHGGRIWIEPRAGGAEVRFFLGAGEETAPCD
jgi:signal transduction histidine kinase